QRAVGVVVVAEVVVAGELAAEDGVLLAQRRLHEGVADALAYGDATVLADVLGDGAAAAQIEEDVAAGVVAEQLAGDERRREVAADRLTLLVDEGGAVGVAVEGDAEVGVVLAHRRLQVVEVLELERVGLVVGEGAVELEVERDDVDAELVEDGAVDRAHAVGGVDGYLEARRAGGALEVGEDVLAVGVPDVRGGEGALDLAGRQVAGGDLLLHQRDAVVAGDRPRLV